MKRGERKAGKENCVREKADWKRKCQAVGKWGTGREKCGAVGKWGLEEKSVEQ